MKILILVFFSIIASSVCNNCPNGVNCGPIVEVGVFIESLCPYSKSFVNDQLYPTFKKLSSANPPVMSINLVPFGNAIYDFVKNSTKTPAINYKCQHGTQECIGNLFQTCAVIQYPIEKSLAFTNCMFASPKWRKANAMIYALECAKELHLNVDELSICANSEEGLAIEYFMKGQTLALNPPKKYVPWITINGVHNDSIQSKATTNLLKLVCDSYTGPKPNVCPH